VPKPQNPVSEPTLAPEKSVPILESLISEMEKLRDLPSDAPYRQEFENMGEGARIAALAQGNPAAQAFVTPQWAPIARVTPHKHSGKSATRWHDCRDQERSKKQLCWPTPRHMSLCQLVQHMMHMWRCVKSWRLLRRK
jgi:hypothetical protein